MFSSLVLQVNGIHDEEGEGRWSHEIIDGRGRDENEHDTFIIPSPNYIFIYWQSLIRVVPHISRQLLSFAHYSATFRIGGEMF